MKNLILWERDIPVYPIFDEHNINLKSINAAIIIMTGNIGSGKSTIAKEILSFINEAVIINDDAITEMLGGNYLNYDENKKELYHDIEEFCVERCIENGFIPIIDMPNMGKKQRKRFIDIAHGKCGIICFDFGKGTKEDLIRRIKEPRGYHNWAEVFNRKQLQYEQPSFDEGINLIIRLY